MKFARDYIQVKNDGTRFFLAGEEVTEEAYRRVHPKPSEAEGPCSLSSTPRNESDALAVHPDFIVEARESAARKGVPTDFTSDGRPVFNSREHKKRYCRAYGFYNNDGGYGDA